MLLVYAVSAMRAKGQGEAPGVWYNGTMLWFDLLFILIMAVLLARLWGMFTALPSDAPYVPIGHAVVKKMMTMVTPQQGGAWIDLGSGDGRVLIAACRRFPGIHAIGIERIAVFRLLSRLHILRAGLWKRIRIKRGNFFDYDLSGAHIVSFYLSDKANKRLAEKFRRELAPGTILVSHRFSVVGFPIVLEDAAHRIYLARA